MRDDEFEWNDYKAMKVRGDSERVSFEDARLVFRDPFGVGYLDDRDYGDAVLVVRHGTLVYEHYVSGSEERWIRIGMVQLGEEQKIVTVIYTEREERKRIITNWIATKDEQDDYYQQSVSDW